MKFLSLLFMFLCVCLAQHPINTDPAYGAGGTHPTSEADIKLAKTQREALIKADHKKNVDDATALLKLAEDLKSEFEKEDAYVISVKDIKETEDIEKLAKNIRGRLKRY
jgi:hypothetical protein